MLKKIPYFSLLLNLLLWQVATADVSIPQDESSQAAPKAGTYLLPPIQPAVDGTVLDTDSQPIQLHELYQDHIVLLNFTYTLCSDAEGCPVATQALNELQAKMEQRPDMKSVRLLTLSIDPRHDTPHMMRQYGGSGKMSREDRRQFLTTASKEDLQPILTAYGQSIIDEYDKNGKLAERLTHMLKVFLIDRQKKVRNIYSASFIKPALLMADIETLLMEEQNLVYADPNNRIAMSPTTGRELDLLKLAQKPLTGLPPLPPEIVGELTKERIALGRKLFYDYRLSRNGTLSCAMCHIPTQGFTSQNVKIAIGFKGHTVRRNAPTLYNIAYQKRLFHDAREFSLENQILEPLLNTDKMANLSIGLVLEKIRSLADYDGLFEAAFDKQTLSLATLGQALASYQRTLLSANSLFDRWYFGGEPDVMSDAAQRGLNLFKEKAGCVQCHTIDTDYALFTDHQVHDTGIGWYRSMSRSDTTTTVQVPPNIVIEVEQSVIDSMSSKRTSDLGYYEITQNPVDRWHYRTPTLRNVALTAPYMHDGSLTTLADVVSYYNQGGYSHPGLDMRIKPLSLSEAEQADLVAFLESLTGDNIPALVSDALAALHGDSQKLTVETVEIIEEDVEIIQEEDMQ